MLLLREEPSERLNVEAPRCGSYCGNKSLADGLADPGTGKRKIWADWGVQRKAAVAAEGRYAKERQLMTCGRRRPTRNEPQRERAGAGRVEKRGLERKRGEFSGDTAARGQLGQRCNPSWRACRSVHENCYHPLQSGGRLPLYWMPSGLPRRARRFPAGSFIFTMSRSQTSGAAKPARAESMPGSSTNTESLWPGWCSTIQYLRQQPLLVERLQLFPGPRVR